MIAQPYHLYIERIDASRNMARFYALSIQPTLFGEPSLMRSWGRIGSCGQLKIHVFEDEAQAVGLFLELVARKRKKGYRPRANCGNRQMRPASEVGAMTARQLTVSAFSIVGNREHHDDNHK